MHILREINSKSVFPEARRRRAFSTENEGFGAPEKIAPSWNLAFARAFEAWPGEAEKQGEKLSAERANNGPPPIGGA